MTVRTILLPLLALTSGLLLLAACNGGDGDEQPPARLTDPRSVPTATPWPQPPEPIILEPGALTPISEGTGREDGNANPDLPDLQVTPVPPFQITSDESTNRRTSPSTDGAVAGTITAGQEQTVVGEVNGEAVQEGNDIWYQLEDGSFVYSGAVKKVE